jgi:ArsR family transcriptional regulator
VPEGANAYFQLPSGAELARVILARLPEEDALLAADRRAAVRLAAERAREASDAYRRDGADWDESRALDLPATAIEHALLDLLPAAIPRFLDIGTGTGRLLELVADRADRALGVDASREMLTLARARLSERGLAGRCAVRQADMYRLPFEDASFDVVALQMVLHYAEEPGAALAEAARVLRPDGRLLVVDLGPHGRADLTAEHAHRWPGFEDDEIGDWLGLTGCQTEPPVILPGRVEVRIWSARRVGAAADTMPALTF